MDPVEIPSHLDDADPAAESDLAGSPDSLLDIKQDPEELVPGQDPDDVESAADVSVEMESLVGEDGDLDVEDEDLIGENDEIHTSLSTPGPTISLESPTTTTSNTTTPSLPQPQLSSDIISSSILGTTTNLSNFTTNEIISTSDTSTSTSNTQPPSTELDNPCPEPIYEIEKPKKRIQRLDQLCCRLIADHITATSIIDEIPTEYLTAIISMIDPNSIDIIQAAPRIHCDAFWKLMSSQWPLADVKRHGGVYKRMFFEKLIQDRLESYHQSARSGQNRLDLMNELEVARSHIHTIVFREQRSHLNLGTILKGFFNLTRLDMRYGAYNLGMMYDPDEFGIKGNDIIGLNQLLADTKSLTMLLIRESLLNDELLCVLCRGLALNQTITYLDLSHNRIGDDGIQKLAQILSMDTTVLISLNLTDNNLGPAGASALAQALISNTVLQTLYLRLNQIGRSGAISIFKMLETNTSLHQLSLSCNGIEDVGQDLINLMHSNHTIQCLDLSANDAIRSEHCPALLDAVKSQSQLWELDLRLNPGLNPQIDMEIRALLNNRQERLDRARRINYLFDRNQL